MALLHRRFPIFVFAGWFVAHLISPALAATAVDLSLLNSLTPEQQQKALSLLGSASSPQRIGAPSALSTSKSVDEIDEPISSGSTDESLTNKAIRLGPKDTIIVYFFDAAQAVAWDKNKAWQFALSNEQPRILAPTDRSKVLYLADQTQNLFRLDEHGVLKVPQLGAFPLTGLDEEEAAARLAVDPRLQLYHVRVRRLPLTPIGVDALKPFGYEIFQPPKSKGAASRNQLSDLTASKNATQFQPDWNIPVPANYVLGPGDTVNVQLFGKDNQEFYLPVSREGAISFPGVGSVQVAGMSFRDVKAELQKRVSKQFIGVTAAISLGELRTIRVFVLGEVVSPGSHLVSGLATVTHALVKSGGVKDSGSLRSVQIKRDGRVIKQLDLYDLLLRGDNSNDHRIEAGDVIYVPAVRSTVSVVGEVRRPAIYEIKAENSVRDVIELAGGTSAMAFEKGVRIERTTDGHEKDVIDVNLTDRTKAVAVVSGDVIYVDSVQKRIGNVVYLNGLTHRAPWSQWREGLRLTDVLESMEALDADADPDYILVKSFSAIDNHVTARSVSLRKALENPSSKYNLALFPRDEIYVFDRNGSRSLVLAELIRQMEDQGYQGRQSLVVEVGGQVHAPGKYPLESEMRVSDLIRASGRLKESAFPLKAELSRFELEQGQPRRIEHVEIDLQKALAGDANADLVLKPHDFLQIKETPLWEEEALVELRGEVQFPGRYPIRRGETLSSVLKRAGGLTQFAYARGAVFTREQLRIKEQEQLDSLAANLQAELAAISLQRSGDPTLVQSEGVATQLLSNLKSTKAVGRLVINLRKIAAAELGSEDDLVLRGGDVLVIPPKMQEVTVLGEVFHPTSHVYRTKMDPHDYIEASGGATRRADEGSTYVIRATGEVVSAKGGWFGSSAEIEPGDTVIVPLDAERISSLKLWTSVSQIVYQLGVAAAAWNTLGVF